MPELRAARRAPVRAGALFGAASRLAVLRRPSRPLAPMGLAALCVAILPWLFATQLLDWAMAESPKLFNPWAFGDRCLPFLFALLGAGLGAAMLGRRGVAAPLAATLLLALLPAALLWGWVEVEYEPEGVWGWLPLAYLAVFVVQAVRWVAADARWLPRLQASVTGFVLLAVVWWWAPYSPWWWTDFEEDFEDEMFADSTPSFSSEQVWNAQPQRLQAALSQLAPQRPGTVDLFVLGVAGDGNESVFRNEVVYLRELASQRLDAAGRVLTLINHPHSLDDTPIASATNLRAALHGIGERMQRDEDILLLFLTSHGSQDHRFQLQLGPLPLDQLDPATLREALDESGIRWRVLVVSACYSGGFIDALKSPDTLVITAARADRTSFGCGAQSDITWFGEAFLTEALNDTSDLVAAFEQARTAIEKREQDEDQTASHPQIAIGERIGAQLARWRAALPVDPPVVPFQPPEPATAE